MILRMAGGLDCGYILWEFKKYEAAILVMGFQNRWNCTQDFMQNPQSYLNNYLPIFIEQLPIYRYLAFGHVA